MVGPSSVVRPSKTLPKNGVSNTSSRLLHMHEAAVKNVKKLLKKFGSINDEFWKGMLAIRNTPLSCGKSPAQLLLWRSLRDSLPRLPFLTEEVLTPDTRKRILHDKSKEKRNYDQQSRVLSPLQPDSRVAIRPLTH